MPSPRCLIWSFWDQVAIVALYDVLDWHVDQQFSTRYTRRSALGDYILETERRYRARAGC